MAETTRNINTTVNLEKVKKLLAKGNVSTALRLLDSKPLNKLDSSPSIVELKGDILLKLKRYDEALVTYSKFIESSDDKIRRLLKIANVKRLMGKFSSAVKDYNILLKTYPENAALLNSLGNSYKEMNDTDKALDFYERAILLDKNHIGAHFNKGLILQEKGSTLTAIESFKSVVNIQPNHFASLKALGRSYFKLPDYNKALLFYRKAIGLKKNDLTTMNEIAEVHNQLGQFTQSQKILEYAHQLEPGDALTLNNLGNTLRKKEEYEKAILVYQRAIQLEPKNDKYYCNMAVAIAESSNYKGAIPIYKKSLRINPQNYIAHNNLGVSYSALGYYQEAIEKFNKVIHLKDDYAEPHYSLGKLYTEDRKPDLAILHYKKALKIDKEHYRSLLGLAYPLIFRNNFTEAWEKYEYRWMVKPTSNQEWPTKSNKKWEGEEDRDLVLWREQGIGDDILFLGLVTEAKRISKSVVVFTQERLISLCERGMPGVVFKPYKNKIDDEDFDYHLPMGSLPRLFRSDIKDFENTVTGYLKADKERVRSLREELGLGDKKVVGISWKSFQGSNMKNKNIEIEVLGPMFKDLDIVLVNLQYGDVDNEIKEFTKSTGIEVLQCRSVDNREDLDGLAALIELCDLVISTSNVTVHLAGALGKETWVLLPYVANFWWLLDRTDSIWYPTLKLYRQKKFQDWGTIPQDVKRDLERKFFS